MKHLHCIVILIIIIQQTCELAQNEDKNHSIMPLKYKKQQKQKLKPQSRIVHGSDASPGQFPWNVLLSTFHSDLGKHFTCGGSILLATWIITASHCLEDQEISEIAVGSIHKYKQAQIQNTTKVFRHPKYEQTTYRYDVALITFDIPLIMDAHVKPVALPTLTQSKKWFTGEQITICGFGRDYARNSPENLQYVNLRVMHNDECKPHFAEGEIIEQTMCVVGQQHELESTCFGDSGGGAVIQIDNVPTIVGIFSFLMGENCNLGRPSAFSRVGYHIEWISKTTGIKVLP